MVLPIQNIENIYISEDVVFTLYSRVSTDKEEQKISKEYLSYIWVLILKLTYLMIR